MSVTAKTKHYLMLDGLRGVAACSVVSLHLCEYFRLNFLPYHAYLAVDFFFLLSGFVIAHAYDKHLSNGFGLFGFLKTRLIRLYPLILLGLFMGTTVFLARAQSDGGITASSVLQAALTNTALLPTSAMLYLRPWAFPIDTPLWSLSFEMGINILYALFFVFLTRTTLSCLLLLGAALLCVTSYLSGGLNTGFAWNDFYLGGARVLFPFVLGVMLSRYMRPLPGRAAWTHLAFIPLIAIMIAPSVMNNGVFDAAMVMLAFPLILIVAAHAPANSRLDPIWRYFGTLSYPVYVIHYPLVVVFSNLAKAHRLNSYALTGAAFATLLVVLLAANLASRFYDIPVRRWLARDSQRRASVQQPIAQIDQPSP